VRRTLIEDRASGQSLIQELRRNTRIPIIAIKPERDKITRMNEVTAEIEGGRVFIPDRAKWLTDFETQIAQFPYGKFDDIVDSLSQFLRWSSKPRYILSKNPLYWK
jgi:predicted phage terminase large subunit-like protein